MIFDVWLFDMAQCVLCGARFVSSAQSLVGVLVFGAQSSEYLPLMVFCLSPQGLCPPRASRLSGNIPSGVVLLTKGFNPLRGSPQGVVLFRGLAIPGSVLNVFTIRLIDSGHEMTMLAYGLRVWKYLVFWRV